MTRDSRPPDVPGTTSGQLPCSTRYLDAGDLLHTAAYRARLCLV